MKVFFDTNVYIAEALLGKGAEASVQATLAARWRIYVSDYVLDEIERVMVDRLRFSSRMAKLSRQRCNRRATRVAELDSRHEVPGDPADGPILRAALSASVDFLVTNDAHLLSLHPYEGLAIISLTKYQQMLEELGIL